MNIRLDRMASVYLPHPFVRKTGIPILMYHSISDGNSELRHPYYRTTTPPSVFEQHLQYLHAKGYSAISLNEVVDHLRRGTLPDRCVALTFDDGFADFLHQAFPIMARYGFTGTVFLPTSYIGDMPMRFKGNLCLTWEQVRELHRAGVVFGSHSKTHRLLHCLSPLELEDELVGSKKLIEDKIGCTVDSFSYPFAFPDTRRSFKTGFRQLIQESGYSLCVSTTIGTVNLGDDGMFLNRLPINGDDDLSFYSSKLRGAYNWIRIPQYLVKSVKALAPSTSLPK